MPHYRHICPLQPAFGLAASSHPYRGADNNSCCVFVETAPDKLFNSKRDIYYCGDTLITRYADYDNKTHINRGTPWTTGTTTMLVKHLLGYMDHWEVNNPFQLREWLAHYIRAYIVLSQHQPTREKLWFKCEM